MPPRTRTNNAPTGTAEPGNGAGSAAQRERRKRILDATLALASKGGFEAVQMRAVAENAGVALGTLYRYFPSKIHLLVAALAQEFQREGERLERVKVPGDTAAERLVHVFERNTTAMQRNPNLTEAMVRAFMFADTTVAVEVEQVGRLMEDMFARAAGIGEPSEQDRAIYHLIADIWMANLIAWVTHRVSSADVHHRIELAVRLLLGEN